MNVAIVGTVGVPACYGGFESLVENLIEDNTNFSYLVFCSEKSYEFKLDFYKEAELNYLPLSANGAQSIFYDALALYKCIKLKPDVVLILGVSGCIFLPLFRLFSKSRVVTNIDGLEWRRGKWSYFVKKFLKLSEKLAVKNSDVVVGDNHAITEYITNEYGIKSEMIAYGGDHAIREPLNSSFNDDFFLGLCRIEPENNVEMILKAFANSSERLIFIGNWEASDYGNNLRGKYSDFKNITILNPVYDLDRLYSYRKHAKGYIHGHSAGGTNPSLVEVMSIGTPVLAFDCNFNRFTTHESAFYFQDHESLCELISSYNKVNWSRVGRDMKCIASREYTWQLVSNAYQASFLGSDNRDTT